MDPRNPGEASRRRAVGRSPVPRRAFLALMLVFLAGCAKVGPDYTPPQTRVPDKWLGMQEARAKEGTQVSQAWWKAFNDPVLDALIAAAYQQNLTLHLAGVRIFEARAQLGIAIGNLYPQTQQAFGSAVYTRFSENSPSAPQPGLGGGVGYDYFEAQIGLGAAWEMDFWGRFRRAVEASDARLQGTVASYDAALVSLTGNVASTYVLIRTIEEQVRISKENILLQKESLAIAQARFKGGATSERDVQQALTQLHGTEAAVAGLETSLRQAKNALSLLLSLSPAEIDGRLDGDRCIPKAPVEITVGIPADLLRRRPDIRLAEQDAMAQCALVGVATADLYPMFSLSGSFGFLASDLGQFRLGDLFSWQSRSGSFGPSVQWNLFNYGQITNQIRVQDARLQELLLAYQDSVLKAQREVEDGLVAFFKGGEQVKFLQLAVAAAKRSAELSLIQYREGATDYTTVLTAQQALLKEQDALATAQGSVPQGMISVYRALGGGWELREGRDFLPVEVRQTMEKRTDWGQLLIPAAVQPPTQQERDALFRAPDW